MKNFQGENSRKEYVSRINRVIDYIKDNPDGDLSLNNLASVAAFSKFYFHRVFKSISGENLNIYVTRIRVEKPAFFLVYSPEKTITTIAYDTDFF